MFLWAAVPYFQDGDNIISQGHCLGEFMKDSKCLTALCMVLGAVQMCEVLSLIP